VQLPSIFGGVEGHCLYIGNPFYFVIVACDRILTFTRHGRKLHCRQSHRNRRFVCFPCPTSRFNGTYLLNFKPVVSELTLSVQQNSLNIELPTLDSVLSRIHYYRIHDYIEQMALFNMLPTILKQNPKVCSLQVGRRV